MKINNLVSPVALTVIVLTTMIACNNEPKEKVVLIDPTNMDSTVTPQSNFFLYVNGGWIKKNPIPASESAWGSFKEIEQHNHEILKAALEAAAADKKAEAGSNTRKVGDFYASGMDSVKLNKDGIKPLAEQLQKINDIKDMNGVMETTAQFQRYFFSPLYMYFTDQDQKNSSSDSILFIPGRYRKHALTGIIT